MFWLGFSVVSFKQQDKFPDFVTYYYVSFQHLCTIENHGSPLIHLTHIMFFYFIRRFRFTMTENRHIFLKFETFGRKTNGSPWPQPCYKRIRIEHFVTNVILKRVCMLVIFVSDNVNVFELIRWKFLMSVVYRISAISSYRLFTSTSSEVRNEWCCTYTLHMCLHDRHRDNFNL